MCDFHLDGTCFHPNLVKKGIVGQSCQVNGCNHCTSKSWQKQQLEDQHTYYQELVKLTTLPEDQRPKSTSVFSTVTKLFTK